MASGLVPKQESTFIGLRPLVINTPEIGESAEPTKYRLLNIGEHSITTQNELSAAEIPQASVVIHQDKYFAKLRLRKQTADG